MNLRGYPFSFRLHLALCWFGWHRPIWVDIRRYMFALHGADYPTRCACRKVRKPLFNPIPGETP